MRRFEPAAPLHCHSLVVPHIFTLPHDLHAAAVTAIKAEDAKQKSGPVNPAFQCGGGGGGAGADLIGVRTLPALQDVNCCCRKLRYNPGHVSIPCSVLS